MTGDNALPLTAFALAFSPVCPLSVDAFAALKVSFPGDMYPQYWTPGIGGIAI